jgi:hypothetical protein
MGLLPMLKMNFRPLILLMIFLLSQGVPAAWACGQTGLEPAAGAQAGIVCEMECCAPLEARESVTAGEVGCAPEILALPSLTADPGFCGCVESQPEPVEQGNGPVMPVPVSAGRDLVPVLPWVMLPGGAMAHQWAGLGMDDFWTRFSMSLQMRLTQPAPGMIPGWGAPESLDGSHGTQGVPLRVWHCAFLT